MAEAQSNDFNQPILNLSPQEKAAYPYLFRLADTDALGVLTGERAVAFFEKTHVPAPVLGEIWQIADTENRGLLTKAGFAMVLRLIACYQAGEQPRTELAFKPSPLPKFDGISVPTPDGPVQARSPTSGQFPAGALQPQLSGQSTGGGPIRVPPLDPTKVQQYSGLFEKSGSQNGVLDGATAKSIFEKSKMPNEMLGRIWTLSDREQKGALDQTEFIVAMHLLTSLKTGAMNALPSTLPQGLYDAAARRGQRPPSRQTSVQAGMQMPRQVTGSQVARTQSPLARPQGHSTPPSQSAQTTGPQWLVSAQDKAQWDGYFATIDTSGAGVISGEQAVRFFSDSRLPEETLASIWDLADVNSEGQLTRDEFAVAMYLIRQQGRPNAPPLPAFLPPALVPPGMRSQPVSQAPQAPPNASNQTAPAVSAAAPKSAAEDLFGLDEPSQAQPLQPTLQPQGTGTSATRDPFSGSQPGSPSSPQRFQPQTTGTVGTTFKPFKPTSAFGASLAQQNTGGSATSAQGPAGFAPSQSQQPPHPPASRTVQIGAMDDLLGDNEAHAQESRKITDETTELANMSNQIGNLRSQMEQTQNKKSATQADLTATNNQKTDLEQRLQQFRSQYETEVRTVKDLEQQLSASRDSTKKLAQELAMLEGTSQDLQTQHTQISQALQADQSENANLKQRISDINAEVARLRPELEKMKLDARQQKGLVSINKKQLTTNEGERDRLQNEKSDLEREAAEQARSATVSPEPAAVTSQNRDVASPVPSTMSSTNPFFRKASGLSSSSPPPPNASGPTPSAFDQLFGPSSAFAPQVPHESATPPATSFVGRNLNDSTAAGVDSRAVGGFATVGAAHVGDSMSSVEEATPSTTPPLSDRVEDGLHKAVATPEPLPPPPPQSAQFTPTNLPVASTLNAVDGSEADSTKVALPASRAGEFDTPRSLPTPTPVDRENIPGAFPEDEARPVSTNQELERSTDTSSHTVAPSETVPLSSKDDFDSAFAGFGESDRSNEAGHMDPFAPSESQAGGAEASKDTGFNTEFPPIQTLEHDDDDSDSGSDEEEIEHNRHVPGTSTLQNGASESVGVLPESGDPAAASDEFATSRPAITSVQSAVSDLPTIDQQKSPPSYEENKPFAPESGVERSDSNRFPPEFEGLLPAREDPTSPNHSTSPPAEIASQIPMRSTSLQQSLGNPEDEITTAPSHQNAASQDPSASQDLSPSQLNSAGTTLSTPGVDVFHDAPSRLSERPESIARAQESAPTVATTTTSLPTTNQATGSKDAVDDFDDFNDLSESKVADQSSSNFDFGFGRQSADEFNPAFDSPAASTHNTPMGRSLQQSQDSSNGFASFTPSALSSSVLSSGSQSGSIQQTPQNVHHDWDAIFSGLDSNNNIDTALSSSDDPWGPKPAGTGNGLLNVSKPTSIPIDRNAKVNTSQLGRAITPGTEHDDPILKRLTGMGYPRSDALNALEMYDYDINKAVDHLSGS